LKGGAGTSQNRISSSIVCGSIVRATSRAARIAGSWGERLHPARGLPKAWTDGQQGNQDRCDRTGMRHYGYSTSTATRASCTELPARTARRIAIHPG